MRERMITRTVVETVYEVMAVKVETKTVETVKISVPSAENISKKNLGKAITDAMPAGFLYVQTISESKVETLYGMPEDEFIRLAKVLPPRTGNKEE